MLEPRECCGTTPDCQHLDDCPKMRRQAAMPGVATPVYPCDRGIENNVMGRGYHDFNGEGVCRYCGKPSRFKAHEQTSPADAVRRYLDLVERGNPSPAVRAVIAEERARLDAEEAR